MDRPRATIDDEPPDEYDGVLIYDGDCPFCSAAATALRRVRGVGAVPYDHDATRAFLEAQFDDAPFALVFVDRREGRVYVGRDAATELCARAGLPVFVSDIVGENYESIADAIRTVAGADRDPAPYHDILPLSDAARDRFDDLAAIATSTVHVSVE